MPKKATTRGIPPDKFFRRIKEGTKEAIDTEMLQLEKLAAEATPVNFGALKQGWFYTPFNGSQAVLSQSKSYFLPVELGRKPGKGISAVGQKAVARWAKLKLGITEPKSAASFAYALSQKYKREGRPANPVINLDRNLEPIPGGLLDKTFKEIDKALDKL
jgi:hypothetical protein